MSVIVCERCGRRYSSELLLRYHFIMEHTSESILCGSCSKRFPDFETRSRHFSAHYRSVHSCNLCAELCRSPLHLYVHLTSVHHYGGASVCHLCKKTLQKRNLKDHYAKKHAFFMQRLEQQAEMLCNVHSSRPFPEESWFLEYVLDWRPEGQQSGAAENAAVTHASSKPRRKKAAALEDHVTATPKMPHGSSGQETACAKYDSWFLPLLKQLYDLNPVYAFKHLDLSQSSTSIYHGLGLDGRKPLDALLDGRKQPDAPLAPECEPNQSSTSVDLICRKELELDQTDLNQSANCKCLDCRTVDGLKLTQPDIISLSWHYETHSDGSGLSEPKISNPFAFYGGLPPFDGKEELGRIPCGLRYEDLASLAADHKPVDINRTSHSTGQSDDSIIDVGI